MSTTNINKRSMFDTVPVNPPDSIFGLIELFKKDANPDKVSLAVGVYQDENGVTPVMKAVYEAEKQLLEMKPTKSYLPIDGKPSYREAIGKLILGDAMYDQVKIATAHTPGGTAALRVSGELMRRVIGVDTIWMSRPTWANHKSIFTAAGLTIQEYDYLGAQGTRLDFQRIADSLQQAKPNDAVLVHTVCHNPTGVDLSREQWEALFQLAFEKSLLLVFDFAYQGFGQSVDRDAWPIRRYAELGGEALVCNSFSKNFGMYGERVGGISAISHDDSTHSAMLSQIKKMIRMMYSNPPLHGGAIVDHVLHSPELKQLWLTELDEIRTRMQSYRGRFVDAMKSRLPDHDFEYINQQRGMFSYSGLSREQVIRLREEFSIYALETGRINIAGLNEGNLDRICDAIVHVFAN